jgi:hypothetical protein
VQPGLQPLSQFSSTISRCLNGCNQGLSEENGVTLSFMCDNQKSGSEKQTEAGSHPGSKPDDKLVSAQTLLKLLWDEESRPSLRWLRQQQAERTLPFIKVGARVWFDPADVRRCLFERWKFGKTTIWK